MRQMTLWLITGSLVFILCISTIYGSTVYGSTVLTPSVIDPFETKQKHLEEAKNQTKLRFHPSENQIKSMYGFTQDYTEIINDQGQPLQIPYHNTQGSLLYYQPGSREHDVMDYTDAVILSNK